MKERSRSMPRYVLGLALLLLAVTSNSATISASDIRRGVKLGGDVLRVMADTEDLAQLMPVIMPNEITPKDLKQLNAYVELLGPLQNALPTRFRVTSEPCQLRDYALQFENGLSRMTLSVCLNEAGWLIAGVRLTPQVSVTARILANDKIQHDLGIDIFDSLNCSEADQVEVGRRFSCHALSLDGSLIELKMKKTSASAVRLLNWHTSKSDNVKITPSTVEQAGVELFRRLTKGQLSVLHSEGSHNFRYTLGVPQLKSSREATKQGFGNLVDVIFLDYSIADRGVDARFRLRFDQTGEQIATVHLTPEWGALRVESYDIPVPRGAPGAAEIQHTAIDQLARQFFSDPEASQSCAIVEAYQSGNATPCQVTAFRQPLEVLIKYSASDDSWDMWAEKPAVMTLTLLGQFNSLHGWLPTKVSCEERSPSEFQCVIDLKDGPRRFQAIKKNKRFVLLDVRGPNQNEPFLVVD
ncbi:MAG: hypothetical protein AB8B96_21710 [Lysobacterales bacterium]